VEFGHCEPVRANPPELTEREREVLRRITDGQSTRQIAKDLDISPATARTHAHNVLVKLGVRSRIQAAATADPAVPVIPPVPVPEAVPEPPDPVSDNDLLAALTVRERDVLACMVEGLARAAIAERLGLSPHTVRTHARNLLGKLGVHSTLEAAALVRRVRAGPSRRQADALRSAVHVGRFPAYEPGQRHPGLAGQFHRQ